MLGITVAMAITFDFTVIPLPFFQSMIAGPTYLLLSSAFRNLRDPFAKQNAARMKNTNPGINGTIYPIIPIPVKKNPSTTQSGLGIIEGFAGFKGYAVFRLQK